MTNLDLILTIPFYMVLILVFVFRNALRTFITKGIETKFDERLESLKSEIRAREHEITILRETVLNRRAYRQNLVDDRRVEAIQNIWSHVCGQKSQQLVGSAMTLLRPEVFERDYIEPSVQQGLRSALKTAGIDFENREFQSPVAAFQATDELFVPQSVWSLYEAHRTINGLILGGAIAYALGVSNTNKYIKVEDSIAKVDSVIPGARQYAEEYGVYSLFNLVDEIDKRLLLQLRSIVQGNELDDADMISSNTILERAKIAQEKSS